MSVQTFTLRKQELTRRIGAVPVEVERWRAASEQELDMNVHFSQLRAIEILTDAFTGKQNTMVASLDPAAATFKKDALDMVREIIRGQRAWDFFRDKLDLRHSPAHKEPLWVADTVAWDCHRPVLDAAVTAGILPATHLREPPLVYCTAELSPATWTRGSRPNDGRAYDLGEARLPIPVIEIPWDTLGNGWELLALHHEVGHDIEADLGLRAPLAVALQTALQASGAPTNRINTWIAWAGEIFADLCALRLAGPAFGDALAALLTLPDNAVVRYDDIDPHPTPYLRILLCAAYARTLSTRTELQDHANRLEQHWHALYGASNAELDAYTGDFPAVWEALMNTKLTELKDHSVAQLIPFGDADDALIRAAEIYFRAGSNMPANLRLRHVPSAARLAIDELARTDAATSAALQAVHERILQYVRVKAPPGLRGGGPDAHEQFIAAFADGFPP